MTPILWRLTFDRPVPTERTVELRAPSEHAACAWAATARPGWRLLAVSRRPTLGG